MHKLTKTVPKTPTQIAVVEIRTTVPNAATVGNFDKRATLLLNGSFQDAGFSYNNVARYSLCFSQAVRVGPIEELMDELRGQYKLIVALGTNCLKAFCNTKKVLDAYAGSLTWNSDLDSWVLPSYHPSVVYVGDKKTLNSRYDKFDILFDHIHRAVGLVNGTIPFPPVEGHQVDWRFIGHNGVAWDQDSLPTPWTGYYEWTDEEVSQAQEVLTSWLGLLDADSGAGD